MLLELRIAELEGRESELATEVQRQHAHIAELEQKLRLVGISLQEVYPPHWMHCTIHLNPQTGEMHSDGDHRVRQWIEQRITKDSTYQVRWQAETITELKQAIDAGGMHLTLCMSCGRAVVAIPDGMPCCEKCAVEAAKPVTDVLGERTESQCHQHKEP